MKIDDINLFNNQNINKNICGIFQVINSNHNIEIINSKFNNNTVSKNGGALYVEHNNIFITLLQRFYKCLNYNI